jgi:HK97 family phage major capsid protein
MTDAERAEQERKTKEGIEAAKAKTVIAAAIAEAQAPLLTALDTQSKAIAELAAQLAKGAGAIATGAQKATNHMGGVDDATRPAITGKAAAAGSGIQAVRVIKAHLAVRLKGSEATPDAVQKQLEQWGYHDEKRMLGIVTEKGLSQGIFADGGAVVPVEYSTELIALLRNATAVRKLGITGIPMGAALEIPSQEQAATAFYVGEGQAITPSQQSFGGLRLAEKKLAALVVCSNDLIRNAFISAEEFIRNDLVNVLALKEDYQALFGTGGEYSPRGLVSLVAAANQYNATAVNQQLPTLQEIKNLLGGAVEKVMASNIPMTKLGWIFTPRTWRYLWTVSDGNGNSIFQQEMNSGKLLGHPFIVTNQIPNNQTWSVDGSTDVSSIFFGDWAQFIIGDAMAPMIEVFPNAAYDVSGTVVSGISKDQSVVRAMQKHDFTLRYRAAFVIIKTRMGS